MDGKGDPGGVRPGRRVRFDRSQGGEAMPMPAPEAAGAGGGAAGWASGRRFVTAAVLAVLVLWGSLYLTFRHWRSGYRERQAFGARHVAAAVDPLASVVPAGECPPAVRAAGCAGAAALASAAPTTDTPPAAWRRAVAETHAMLVTLTAANLLDLDQMDALRRRVAALASGARPATSRAGLAALWDELEAQAGPVVLARHTRPSLLPPHRADAPR